MAISIAERIRAAVLTRLKEPTPVVPKAASIRRSHLVDLPRDDAPYVYVIDGDEANPERRGDRSSSCPRRRLEMTVRIGVRSDAGTTAADPLFLAVLARLDPEVGAGYGPDVICALGTIRTTQDVADRDSVEIDIGLEFLYGTRGEFKLEAAS